MTKISRWLRFAVLVPGTLFLWSCVAPILTVPPPASITFIPTTLTDASGAPRTFWTTQGAAFEPAANATYYVYNRNLGSGVYATAEIDGSFVAPPMEGGQGDPILVSYRTLTGDYSDSTCLLLDTSPRACPP
jgi:hypothetical protein